MLQHPPLSLYIHLPWCVRKCPYCDFNSHAGAEALPFGDYVRALTADLEQDLPRVWGRPVVSVFFGGGTPSLFPAEWIDAILQAVGQRLSLRPDAEVTLEANPGAVEYDRFAAYREAGVNRVSLGVQSFDDALLQRIGRIHGAQQARQALKDLQASGITNFNIDLMYGLPGQRPGHADRDVDEALGYRPAHISHYQLTIEPNTAFAHRPPTLPNASKTDAMQAACEDRLVSAGYQRYEVSAYARDGRACTHNLNYWRFGDYLGIGAGAHGKLTLPSEGRVVRTAKLRHPKAYIGADSDTGWLAEEKILSAKDLMFEFFLNQLRLARGVHKSDFSPRTGLDWESVQPTAQPLIDRGLLRDQDARLVPTARGYRFLNDLQAAFLP